MANWLFQGNPGRYDVMADVEAQEPIDSWAISRHIEDLQMGDRAALWVSGSHAGVYVLGEVTGPPFEETAAEGWSEADQGRVMTFASVLLDDFLTANPITKAELAADARFAGARILTQPQAGNPFRTTDDEWAAIEDLRQARKGIGGQQRRGRNPTWAWDELILALDLYLREGLLDDTNRLVIELSEILNRLPIHTVRPDEQRFRNPNGVALKLANLAALDPAYEGVGMSRGGKRDVAVWDRYHEDREEVGKIAADLKAGVSVPEAFPVAPEEDEDEVEEGRLLYRRHRARERNRALVERKKAAVMAKAGRLACEVCGFQFSETYGDLGKGFIEAHHLVALSDAGLSKTKLSDLAVLCSNCHRMAHRRRPWPTVSQLRALLRKA